MKSKDSIAAVVGVVLAAEVVSAAGWLWICGNVPALKLNPVCVAPAGVLSRSVDKVKAVIRATQTPLVPDGQDVLPRPSHPPMPLPP